MNNRNAGTKPRTFQRIVKIVCFLLIFLLLFLHTQSILQDKSGIGNVISVQAEQPGTVDIALMGTSHMHSGVYPMELYQEFGFTSINQAQSAQSIPITYYAAKEVIEKQAPKVIVLDIYYLYLKSTYSSKSFTHQSIDHLTPLDNKITCVMDLAPPEEWAEFLVPMVSYHSRWNALTHNDFEPAEYSITKGASQLFSPEYSGEDPVFELIAVDEVKEPPEVPLEYLQKIVDLCQSTNTELVLLVLPYCAYGEEQRRDLSDDQRYFNWMRGFAEKNNVNYINMFDHLDDIDFDMKADMREWNHLNYNGAKKMTSYLGQYLQETYSQLPDNRGKAGYESWDTSLREYTAYVAAELEKLENPPEEETTAGAKTEPVA